MCVLDLGSGAGRDARRRGGRSFGGVLGVDAAPRVVEMARRRAEEAGRRNVEFVVGHDEQISNHGLFDAAIGRCILIHQPDPAATVRRTAAAVRPGGIDAFMEPATHVSGHSTPEVPLVRAAGESLMRFFRVALPSHDIAGRIIPCFIDAGLPEPQVLWEAIVPGSDITHLRWFISTYRTFLPLMERFGTVDPAWGGSRPSKEAIGRSKAVAILACKHGIGDILLRARL
jgi:SAM-dependent methyltransferase